MPIAEHNVGGFDIYRQPEPEAPAEPTWQETWEAGFRLENDFVNATQALSRPIFPENPDFNLMKRLKESPYWDDYRDNFIGVASDEEFTYRAGQIEQERKDKETFSRAGWGGVVAGVGAGVFSPTFFIPFMGQARGARAIAEAAGYGLAAGVAQELPLMANQQTRTGEEIAFSIAASTVLSGILGGAVVALRKGEFEAIEQSMVNQPGGIAILPSNPNSTSSLSAAGALPASAGGLPGVTVAGRQVDPARIVAAATDSNALTRSPVTHNLNSDSKQAQYLMAQYADAGLSLEGNKLGIPTTPGGTIENAVNLWNANFAKGVKALDDNYAQYYFEGVPPTLLPNQRANIGGLVTSGKMSKQQFREEVGKAMFIGDEGTNPQVTAAAQAIRKEVYEPVLKALQEVQLLKEEVGLLADPSYLNRVFRHETINRGRKNARGEDFTQLLTRHFNDKLQADFAKKLEGLRTKQAETDVLLTDIRRSEEEVAELTQQFRDELKAIDESVEGTRAAELDDTIAELRSRARALKGDDLQTKLEKRQLLKDARDMEAVRPGEPVSPSVAVRQAVKAKKSEITKRLRNLSKAQVVLEDKTVAKLEKIERSEELSMNTLNRAARAGYKFLSEMDKWSDEVLDEKLSNLKTQFAQLAEQYDKREEALVRLARTEEEADTAKLLAGEGAQESKAARMDVVAERIADAEDLGRDALRSMIDDMLQQTLQRIGEINSRRAIRNAKLMEQARQMAPESLEARIAKITGEKSARATNFNEAMRVAGADDVDIAAGTADFSRQAKEDAEAVTNKILGTFVRLPTVEVMQDKRGATLTRVLDVPSSELEPWLETDIEKLIRSHIYTMGPDIEIARKFQGSVNLDTILAPMWDEMQVRLDAVDGAVDKKGKPLSAKAKEEMNARIRGDYELYKRNMEAVHQRLRHSWGLPTDPNAIGYRLAKTVMHLNVLRYMGGVTISSLPDVGRPIMRYGLTRTFRDGFIPLITNFKSFKLSAAETRYAGVGNDTILNLRAQTVLDIMDSNQRGSKFERGVEYLSSRQGIVALFNIWTDAMKQFTGVVSNAKIMDSIAVVNTGNGNVAEATQWLAQVGIGGKEASEIWEQAVKADAAQKVNGVWMPNTEVWENGPALRAYRAALAREVNNVIITPGVERPLWTNANTMGRVISQFKSFAFSSTQKTLMAGLQQRDMAFVNGVMVSLAFGGLSYYLWALSTGGKAYEEMINADPTTVEGAAKWADEMITRSGITAVFGLGQDLLSRIPLTSDYATFTGGRSSRRGGDDLIEAVLGPSFDFAKTSAEVAAGIDDPTQSTLHKGRTLLPYQNTIILREAFDAIENANPFGLSERRN